MNRIEKIAGQIVANKLTGEDVVYWLKKNIYRFPSINENDLVIIHREMVKDGIARNDDMEVVLDALNTIKTEMGNFRHWGNGFRDTLKRLGSEKTAAWMATGQYKTISLQNHNFVRSASMVDKQANDLLRDLSSPIEPEDTGTVLRKVRVLKTTLGMVGENHSKLLESIEGLEDKLTEEFDPMRDEG